MNGAWALVGLLLAQTEGADVTAAEDGDAIGAATALGAARAARAAEGDQSFGGSLGLEKLGEDWFISLGVALSFDWDEVGFGLQLPLRFRIIDEAPQNDGDLLGIIREEDWDSVADVLKVLRYLYIGQRDTRGPYYFRVGALTDLRLGHGTIVHRYRNDVDINRWRVGVQAALQYESVGGHIFVGDVTKPYLFGGRVHVRPLEMALGSGIQRALVLGTSLVLDASAPLSNCLTPVGGESGCLTPLEASADPTLEYETVLDDQGRPVAADTRTLGIWGIDVGYELIATPQLAITPYFDFNKITGVQDGWGAHAGVLWNVDVPVLLDRFVLDLRTEYRLVSHDYRGPYVGSTYEIERSESFRAPDNFLGLPGRATRLGYLCGSATGDCDARGGARHGYFIELLTGLPSWIFVGGELLDYTGDEGDGSFRLTLEVPALSFVDIWATYYRTGVRDLSDLFAIDDRSAVLAHIGIPFAQVFALQIEWSRIWEGDSEGGYAPVDDFRAGVGLSVPL